MPNTELRTPFRKSLLPALLAIALLNAALQPPPILFVPGGQDVIHETPQGKEVNAIGREAARQLGYSFSVKEVQQPLALPFWAAALLPGLLLPRATAGFRAADGLPAGQYRPLYLLHHALLFYC